jgi:hypothetical protein
MNIKSDLENNGGLIEGENIGSKLEKNSQGSQK